MEQASSQLKLIGKDQVVELESRSQQFQREVGLIAIAVRVKDLSRRIEVSLQFSSELSNCVFVGRVSRIEGRNPSSSYHILDSRPIPICQFKSQLHSNQQRFFIPIGRSPAPSSALIYKSNSLVSTSSNLIDGSVSFQVSIAKIRISRPRKERQALSRQLEQQ